MDDPCDETWKANRMFPSVFMNIVPRVAQWYSALVWQSKRRCFGSHEGHINQSSWDDQQLAGFSVILSLAAFPSPWGTAWASE